MVRHAKGCCAASGVKTAFADQGDAVVRFNPGLMSASGKDLQQGHVEAF